VPKRGSKRAINEPLEGVSSLMRAEKRNILRGNRATAKRTFSSGQSIVYQDIVAAPDARKKEYSTWEKEHSTWEKEHSTWEKEHSTWEPKR
jgi:hypothetical protein